MKFKLDENLGRRGAKALIATGHDVATVVEQSMTSATDAACKRARSSRTASSWKQRSQGKRTSDIARNHLFKGLGNQRALTADRNHAGNR